MPTKTSSKVVKLPAVFRLVPISELLPHEEVDPETIDAVERRIKERKVILEPLLVAEGSLVVLNGHHRLEVLKRLGAKKVPAWVIDYDHASITVDLWPESGISKVPSKRDIVTRARKGHLYPPKTSHHKVSRPLPKRKTSLNDLF